jgi:hypothetical protein
MDNAADIQLTLMAQSLQEHISRANELKLGFAAQLLAMAVMEITINMHGISQQEIDALCERIEEKQAGCGRQAMKLTAGSRSFDRRSRARRSRIG